MSYNVINVTTRNAQSNNSSAGCEHFDVTAITTSLQPATSYFSFIHGHHAADNEHRTIHSQVASILMSLP